MKSYQDFTLRLLPPSNGKSESLATLSSSQYQVSGFAGGTCTSNIPLFQSFIILAFQFPQNGIG